MGQAGQLKYHIPRTSVVQHMSMLMQKTVHCVVFVDANKVCHFGLTGCALLTTKRCSTAGHAQCKAHAHFMHLLTHLAALAATYLPTLVQ